MSCCTSWSREKAPVLHDLYAKKLLIPGWAGEADDTEAECIASKLTKSPTLRRQWQVARFTRRRKSITPAIAKRLVQWWAEKPTTGDERRLSDTVRKGTRVNVGTSRCPGWSQHVVDSQNSSSWWGGKALVEVGGRGGVPAKREKKVSMGLPPLDVNYPKRWTCLKRAGTLAG